MNANMELKKPLIGTVAAVNSSVAVGEDSTRTRSTAATCSLGVTVPEIASPGARRSRSITSSTPPFARTLMSGVSRRRVIRFKVSARTPSGNGF